MPVPEAAMHKDHGSILGQHQIWTASESFDVQSKTETSCMQRPPDCHLRLGILGADL